MLFNNKRVFVAGTDTDAGKTYVSVQLLKMYSDMGFNPCYFKPVATGGVVKGGELVSEDILQVKKESEIYKNIDYINPLLYKTPAAPYIAGMHENKNLNLNKIYDTYEKMCIDYECFVVEGIGGVMVPLTKEILVIDLIKKWDLPVVLVSKVVLGMINHTLLTLSVLKQYGINVLGIIFSYADQIERGKAVEDSFEVIQEISNIPIIKVYNFDRDY